MTLVSVVIPYYDAQQRLDLVLEALGLQTWPAGRLEVVVADDGSPAPPQVGVRRYRTLVVRQPDQGFRAAAARNLGAAASSGDVLCFVDGDTVPGPGYVAAAVRAVSDRQVLVVGRRRHVDLQGWTPARLRDWLLGLPGHQAPRELPEPQWLVEAFARTNDLADADDDAYRFVIGAVLTLPRSLFDAVGGFEPSFTAYGGEDWELANRCWLAGADFAHAPEAVAWHDGHDFAGRDESHTEVKNVEAVAVASFITDPAARGHGLVWTRPDVVVRVADQGWSDAAVLLTVASLVRDTDAGVWLASGRTGSALHDDPRVHLGQPGPDVLACCRYQVDVTHPLVLADVRLRELCADAPLRLTAGLTVRRTRDLNRGDTQAPSHESFTAEPLADTGLDLERAWGRSARRL